MDIFIYLFYRCDYHNTCELLISLFDTSASSYQQLLQSSATHNENDMALREGTPTIQLLHVIRLCMENTDDLVY